MVKIFLQDRSITLVREIPREAPAEGVLLVHSDSANTSYQAFQSFKTHPSLQHLLLVHPNPITHIEELKEKFHTIRAGGGVVQDQKGDLLMIFRKGKWDLPKGKLDAGESPENGAIREVVEECAIPQPVPEGFLMRTYHTYEENGKNVLKETWWFRMSVKGTPALKPQSEEGITEAKWIPVSEVEKKLKESYSSIADLLAIWLSREGRSSPA